MLTEEQRTLVEKNLPLAVSLAGRFLTPTLARRLSREDADQEAALAMCRAALGFDGGRGRFSTYAGMAIFRQVRHAAVCGGVVSLPALCREAAGPRGLPPEDEAKAVRAWTARGLPGHYPDTTPGREPGPADEAASREAAERLNALLRRIDARLALVVWLVKVKGLLYRQVGEFLGVSRERVRQLLADGMSELRGVAGVQVEEDSQKESSCR